MISADYYDGKSATRHSVTLHIDGGIAHIEGEGIKRDALLSSLRISEPMGNAPRVITFADGAICEVRDHVTLNALLAQTGYQEKAVVRWAQSGKMVLAMLALSVLFVLASYRYGLPLFADMVAERLPADTLAKLGDHVLAALDESMFKPSTLSAARQKKIIEGFERLKVPGGRVVPHKVLFRNSPQIGANAFALPSGDIVMTDELVALAKDDTEVHAVLAHELGHLEKRHSLRQLLQATIVGLVVSWYIGDVSSLLASAPVAILQARYSRDFEREADTFGAAMLRANGLSPGYLANMLERLEQAHGGGEPDSKSNDYFSTHPGTQERVRVLRQE